MTKIVVEDWLSEEEIDNIEAAAEWDLGDLMKYVAGLIRERHYSSYDAGYADAVDAYEG